MKRWIYALPVLAFGLLAFFLFRSLWDPAPRVIPSALLNKPVPRLVLPPLDDRSPAFTPADLASGRVSVVNVFASWCAPCRVEAPQLAALAKVPGIAMYGLVQKDKPQAARAFLDEVGNPFHKIAMDADGRASIEWGVYGVPETFVVDGEGIIRYKHIGPIDPAALENEIRPAIEAALKPAK